MGAAFKVECPKCGRKVCRVDGEYERHGARGELCTMSKRHIAEAGRNGRHR